MFKTFRDLASHIGDTVTAINWIDRDKGQLEKPDSFNSIIIPGILLDFSEIVWFGTTKGNQTGTGQVTVKLIFSLPPATYESSAWSDYPEYEQITNDLYQSISQFNGIKDRTKSSDYYTGSYYVCEQVFNLTVYQVIQIRTMQKPKPEIQGTLSHSLNIPIQ
ncbi:hypothetical protein [Dyadobacter frigoris]|uniref:Uncharacterized protein n=1 Tax=Dyadobacter frigoris TaxID=2576211 RepID=A0A4U6D146_9BACT|nr:hypothetical protein [Dyadobacter frigoris]TKT89488.1 hypothetical protein FDK13_24405 [Dyadobacter frigoris]